ncbi:MAG: hypothetical protein PHH24_04465 [Candidatus Moranbacteria bacterium]|jgi:hypothetical protein|nr:hypothetical protein [Candidatus Moranbacteria bacterium]MDX9855931.1 hypothetical protein [Candidatus Moranbacteria bacterium]
MALYAKKIDYVAYDGEEGSQFAALIKLSKKKGGEPISFVLYRYDTISRKPEMIERSLEKEARKIFPYGREDPFIWEENDWLPTTRWLYPVAVGGGYGIYQKETWVKVGRPCPKRRRKKSLKFGELSCIYSMLSKKKEDLSLEICMLKGFQDFHAYDSEERIKISFNLKARETEKENIEYEMEKILKEMKFAKDQVLKSA